MIGERFGRLVGVADARLSGRAALVCRCDCGTERTFRTSHLRSGLTRSCGCLKRETSEVNGRRNKRHGAASARTPTYSSWKAMRTRCLDENADAFARYGGQGIRICDRWSLFENFLADMGERPGGTSLDRINGNGHYEPSNCRWATNRTQTRNRKNTVLSAHRAQQIRWLCGLGLPQVDAARRLGVSTSLVNLVVKNKIWNH